MTCKKKNIYIYRSEGNMKKMHFSIFKSQKSKVKILRKKNVQNAEKNVFFPLTFSKSKLCKIRISEKEVRF